MASSFLAGAPDDASCMRYEIYVLRDGDEGGGAEEPGREPTALDVDTVDDASLLAAARSHVLSVASGSPAARDYIWYRDSLASSLRASASEEAPWRRRKSKASASASSASAEAAATSPSRRCLWGELDFGDAVDDEWVAAWILLQATAESFEVAEGGSGGKKAFRLAARCWDDDGDFLLIEAADALPRWLTPSSSENRCWMSRGRVHVIPRRWKEERKGGGSDALALPTVDEALEVLSRPSTPPSASSDAGPKVHAALLKRLGEGRGADGGRPRPPSALARPLHRSRALLPPSLAAVVSEEPSLVSSAVDAFYRRDPEGVAAAARASWFPLPGPPPGAAPPPPSPSRLVPALLTTTRLQFAQLALQRYLPPARAGWPSLPAGHPDAAAVELGAKVAAGFEIVMSTRFGKRDEIPSPSSSPSRLPSDPAALDALDPPGWRDLLGSLERRGAFDGEVEGSARRRELRRQAAAAFVSSPTPAKGRGAAPPSPAPPSAASAAALRAASILERLGPGLDDEASVGPLRAAGEAAVAARGESSTAWLTAAASAPTAGVDDEDEFEKAIAEEEARQASSEARRKRRKEKGGGAAPTSDGGGDEDFDPASVVEKVKSFVDKMSSWEGATVGASEAAAAAPAAGAKGDDGDDADDVEGFSLDERSFWDELGAALGFPTGGAEEGLPGRGLGLDGDGESDSSDDEGSSFYSDGDSSEGDGGGDGRKPLPSPRLPRALVEAEAARLRALEASGDSRSRRAAPPPEEREGDDRRQGASPFVFPRSSAAEEASKREEEEDDFAFATAYEAELGRQLAGTTLGQTWAPPPSGGKGDDGEGGAPSRSAKRAATAATAVGGSGGISCVDGSASPLAPVDVDVNLLESLLASYAGEAGLPGPASSLLGMLGVSSLPVASTATATSTALAPPTPSTSEDKQ